MHAWCVGDGMDQTRTTRSLRAVLWCFQPLVQQVNVWGIKMSKQASTSSYQNRSIFAVITKKRKIDTIPKGRAYLFSLFCEKGVVQIAIVLFSIQPSKEIRRMKINCIVSCFIELSCADIEMRELSLLFYCFC